LALTFDDGPDPHFTPLLLDLLRNTGVRATFFLIGSKVQEQPELAARIAAEGHALGGHGFDHHVITSMSRAELGVDLERCRTAIRRASGVDTRLFRPPKGEVSLASIHGVHRHGYRLAHWSLTYSDYRCDGSDLLLERMVARPPRSGEVVLLHDNNPYTVQALSRMLPLWAHEGLRFATL
jgi:peptidoglycan/xylan/chitin deacetylase (PgdA/CDA1 family)